MNEVSTPPTIGAAIRRKLVLEIADLVPRRPMVVPVRGYDCMIGERQLQQWLVRTPFGN